MNRIVLTIYILLACFVTSCKQKDDCSKLPIRFSSYDEAVSKIESSSFKIKEQANTLKSSWIRGASFYSCDGTSGFFVLQTDNNSYLYSDLPYSIWKEFKTAESLGKYYNEKIRHHYIFQLTK